LPSLGRRGEGWVVAQVMLGCLVALFGFVGPDWPASMAGTFTMAGIVVVAAGLVLLLAGAVALGRSLTPLPRPKDEASMRERGAYGLVRHPIYGGAILVAVGWSMAGTALALVPTVLLAAFLELKSRREEAWLVERYTGYEAYRRRVRWRFVPGIR